MSIILCVAVAATYVPYRFLIFLIQRVEAILEIDFNAMALVCTKLSVRYVLFYGLVSYFIEHGVGVSIFTKSQRIYCNSR